VLTPSDFGKLCEFRARDLLQGSEIVEKYNSPYDLIWKKKRIEVKGTRKGTIVGWLLAGENRFDLLLVFCDEIKKAYLIPFKELKKRNFWCGNLNIKGYSKFEIEATKIYG